MNASVTNFYSEEEIIGKVIKSTQGALKAMALTASITENKRDNPTLVDSGTNISVIDVSTALALEDMGFEMLVSNDQQIEINNKKGLR